jgi:hypothetical protein
MNIFRGIVRQYLLLTFYFILPFFEWLSIVLIFSFLSGVITLDPPPPMLIEEKMGSGRRERGW